MTLRQRKAKETHASTRALNDAIESIDITNSRVRIESEQITDLLGEYKVKTKTDYYGAVAHIYSGIANAKKRFAYLEYIPANMRSDHGAFCAKIHEHMFSHTLCSTLIQEVETVAQCLAEIGKINPDWIVE